MTTILAIRSLSIYKYFLTLILPCKKAASIISMLPNDFDKQMAFLKGCKIIGVFTNKKALKMSYMPPTTLNRKDRLFLISARLPLAYSKILF